MYHADFLIVGAGIVGLTLARELMLQGAENIVIIEKEASLGLHASGRNSGVLHAGIYYPPETLKAKLCLQGNLLLQAYCQQKNLPLVNTGKVIVATQAEEVPTLLTLYARAKQNGARVEMIDEQQLSEIEPNARTYEQALFSKDTAIVDNKAILQSLYADLLASKKIKIYFNEKLTKLSGEAIAHTNRQQIHYKEFINAAGAYADKLAHLAGVANAYYFIPFKGIYHQLLPAKSNLVNGNIYPVPHLGNPFLGVHFSKNINGAVYVGPTAIPAFGRENYGILRGIDAECLRIVWHELLLSCFNSEFRTIARQEPKKYLASYFFRDAKRLVKQLQPDWLVKTAKVGIRPQLIDRSNKTLVMDFLLHQDKNQLHILNAISPAFTSSMAFAKYIIQHYYS